MIRPSSLPVSAWTAVIVISQLMALLLPEDLVCHIDTHILPLSVNAVKLFTNLDSFHKKRLMLKLILVVIQSSLKLLTHRLTELEPEFVQ